MIDQDRDGLLSQEEVRTESATKEKLWNCNFLALTVMFAVQGKHVVSVQLVVVASVVYI